MGLGERLKRLVGADAPPRIRVHLLLKGRIGDGWYDVDRDLALPAGATLEALLEAAVREGIDLRRAIASSPHLAHTLMLNGERCPLQENLARELREGDQVYLLAPLAGG
ncbi:MAG: MoaD/ThiS family protein [Deltaproteobacteria bacterium]|nr:MoaD/ThiS family protein [Deltaproteobacteria bacterium]